MTTSSLPAILKTRLLVGYLGERSQHAWWPTAFHEVSSGLFLEPVFTRTSLLAQYHGVVDAARRLHDEHLSAGSYHLFRLPEEVEQDLHNLVQLSEAGEFAVQHLSSKGSALNCLKDMAGQASTKISGPIEIAQISEPIAPNVVKAIAAAYLSAFINDTHVFPYLSA